MLGLNFVPTPNWSEKVEYQEWISVIQHIRRVEWQSILGAEEK